MLGAVVSHRIRYRDVTTFTLTLTCREGWVILTPPMTASGIGGPQQTLHPDDAAGHYPTHNGKRPSSSGRGRSSGSSKAVGSGDHRGSR